MADVFLSLGSNIGNRHATLTLAVRNLEKLGRVVAASPIIETTPMYIEEQPMFLNMAVRLETALSPEQLLMETQALEHDLGRQRRIAKGPRVIDIDIIYYDDIVQTTPWLILPHPLRMERGFVLEPLAAIAPDKVDPLAGRTVQALWMALYQSASTASKAA